jgi:hypothetical protein
MELPAAADALLPLFCLQRRTKFLVAGMLLATLLPCSPRTSAVTAALCRLPQITYHLAAACKPHNTPVRNTLDAYDVSRTS